MIRLTEDKKDSNSFIAQAGILAAAGIVSRIIGLLYRSPLSAVLGDLGLGYYQEAYSFYLIVLLISSYSIPSAISKVIAQKLALREYRNAHRLFLGSMIYVLVVGGVASLFLFFGAGLFVEDVAVPVLRTFAPTVFVYGILGVLRGYFQAHKSMVQTSVSQILEQIANAVVSIGAAVLLIKISMGTLEQPASAADQIKRAVRGAMGSATGTGTGVVVALIFMTMAYMINRSMILRRVREDRNSKTEDALTIIKTITFTVTPFILSTAVYNLSDSVNTKIFLDMYPRVKELDPVSTTSMWGIFSGKARTISNIPIAFASAMAAAMIPSVAQLSAAGEHEATREKIGIAVKTTMLISIPSAVGLFVLAGPVTLLLFPNSAENLGMARGTLMALSVSVVLYALSTLNSSILQGIGKVNTPIINAAIALVVQTLLLLLLLFTTGLGVYSVAIANTVYSGLMAYLNQRAVRKASGYTQEIRRTFGLTFASSVGMGLGAYGVYRIFLLLTSSPRISVIPAVLFAVPVYFALLLKTGAMTEEELMEMPKGKKIVALARRVRLL